MRSVAGYVGGEDSLLGGNRRLVTDEQVEVGDFRRITDHLRGIYRMYIT